MRAQREDELVVLPRPTASETAGARAISPAVRFQTSLVCKLGPVSDSVTVLSMPSEPISENSPFYRLWQEFY